jgi:hypothetical protein
VTLHELKTIYDLEDLYDMLEVGLVNAHNERIVRKARERKNADGH